jgi:prolipoprotein diacylglyceryl transferase
MPPPYSPYLVEIGPYGLRWYSALIIAGIILAVLLARREFARRGYDPDLVEAFALAAVPLGIIGARLYHVLTSLDLYMENWPRAFEIWSGGLGIYGAVIGGAVGMAIVAWRRRVPLLVAIDCVVPGLILAQAVGRWGNYFNQEIFGPPTDLPWGLAVDPPFRPAAYAAAERFHPTFLYESLWNLAVGLLLLGLSRRYWRSWLPGTLALLYLATYSLGRFALENLKVDEVLHLFGLRFNLYTSLAAMVIFGLWFLLRLRRAGSRPFPVGSLLARPATTADAVPGADDPPVDSSPVAGLPTRQ